MNKKYSLLKDLPDSKAGDIYKWVEVHGRGAYYLNGETESSYWAKEHVENNQEWFAPVVTTATIELKSEITFNKAWEVFCNACGDLGIEIPASMPIDKGIISHHFAELEACWNAARAKDRFSQAISQPFKYNTFQDYLNKKEAKNENSKNYPASA